MRATLLIVVMGFSASIHAAETMKPGLWEMTMKSDEARQMPKIAPEQAEQMRKMGIEVPATRDGATVHRVCITKEMAGRNQTPGLGREQNECKLKSQDRSGDSYRAELVCDGPNLKGTGTIKGILSGGTSYTSTYDFKGTSGGRPAAQHRETSGKWLAANCGNVRPMDNLYGGSGQ